MKHTLTFQGKKIGLSIACKKSTLYLCTNKENNFLKREDNRKHVNPLLYRGLFLFRACFAKKQRCFLCPARKYRNSMRSRRQAAASKHPSSRPVSRHSLSVSGRFRRAEAFRRPLVAYSPPTVQKDALAQNNSANAAHSTPTIRVGAAPHSPPRKPKSPSMRQRRRAFS